MILHRDLKTVTIWFQNRRQTVARSRKHLESEDATTSTATMDMLASASATMSPLAATEEPPASSASAAAAVQLGSGTGTPRLQRASSRHSFLKPKSQPLAPPRVLLSTVAHDPNVPFTPVRAETLSSSSISVSSPSPDLRKSRLGHNWPIHPEDLWKHIPSSPAQPALSSPDVSPDISASSSGSSRLSVQRPRTLEWACARSAKRRRANPDANYHVDDEIHNECNSVDCSDPRRSFFLGSEAQVPPECYDKYPLDVVRGAVLLLGLRDAARGLGI
ncbi:hypothetical protein BJV74DRAFT_826146 [Russula compacta]|nr:hypothetical protein BJV74DRAFT_826146 [Russula compacta]